MGRLTRQEETEIREILREKFDYYNQLSHKGRRKFYRRLLNFIKSKRFIGKEGLKITPEILVLVGASAIQLTFGLSKYRIAHFKVILMFPSTFHFRLLNKDLKGGVSPRGTLWLSWEAFQHGYEVPDDKRNLGLHELAHALKLDVLGGSEFDRAFASYIEDWQEVATTEFKNLKGGGKSFFRKYGGTNRMEFFAVAVEHFFEAPEEFYRELPDIYNHLCVLLNQNPLNEHHDFELTSAYIKKENLKRRKFPLPEKIVLSYKYGRWHWSYSLIFGGLCLAWPWAISLFEETMVTQIEICAVIALTMLIGGYLQYPLLVKTEIWSMTNYPLYLIFGCAPIICLILLKLNYSYTIGGPRTEYINVNSVGWDEGHIVLNLQNDKYQDKLGFRSYGSDIGFYSRLMITDNVQVKLVFRRGTLGYWVLIRREVIIPESE